MEDLLSKEEDPLCNNQDCFPERRNLSFDDTVYSISTDDIFGCVVAIMIPIIFIGNSLVIITLYRFPKFRTTTNLLIGSLAMADLLLGVVTLPLYVCFYFHGDALSRIKYLCLIKYSFALGTLSASLISLVAIAFDRFIAITRPLIYRVTMTKRRAMFIIVGIWMYHLIVAFLPLIGWNHYNELNNNVTHICNFFTVLPVPYTVLTTPVVIMLAIAISTYLYFKIYQETVSYSKRQLERRSTSSNKVFGRRQFKRDTKSAKMMGLISILFYIFWIPFMIGCIIKYISNNKHSSEMIKNIFLTLAMSNSAVNPFIYCWLREDFRTAFLMIVCCRKTSSIRQMTSMKQNLGIKGTYNFNKSQNRKSSLFTVEKVLKPLQSNLSDSITSSYGDVSDCETPQSVASDADTPHSVFSDGTFSFSRSDTASSMNSSMTTRL